MYIYVDIYTHIWADIYYVHSTYIFIYMSVPQRVNFYSVFAHHCVSHSWCVQLYMRQACSLLLATAQPVPVRAGQLVSVAYDFQYAWHHTSCLGVPLASMPLWRLALPAMAVWACGGVITVSMPCHFPRPFMMAGVRSLCKASSRFEEESKSQPLPRAERKTTHTYIYMCTPWLFSQAPVPLARDLIALPSMVLRLIVPHPPPSTRAVRPSHCSGLVRCRVSHPS